MCVKENYNTVLESNNFNTISSFMDLNCRQNTSTPCCKLCGGCDYLGMLDDKLKELEERGV